MRFTGRIHGQQRVGVALVFALVLAGLVMVGHATTAPPDVQINIQNFAFIGPDTVDGNVTVPVGTKVTWTNLDGPPTQHTTTSDAAVPVWDSLGLAHGASFSFTFNQVGTFPYHCSFHSFIATMHGTITVVATPPNPTGVSPTSGSSGGGTNVTISGTGFQSGATISFGGVAATNVQFVNATTITATTPAHGAGTVNIVVTNPDSTTGTLNAGFTFVTINPLPPLRPSAAPISGATPLPPTRQPGPTNPAPPAPLPGGRPPGGAAGAPGGAPSGPAPLPIPSGR